MTPKTLLGFLPKAEAEFERLKAAKISPIAKWIADYEAQHGIIALFSTTKGTVIATHTIFMPKAERTVRLLNRSPEFEAQVRAEAQKVIDSYNDADAPDYQGLIYLVYFHEDGFPVVNYSGIAHKFGRGKNLNANLNFKGKATTFFARWGDDAARHIGGLSNAVFQNFPAVDPKYARWADLLFDKTESKAESKDESKAKSKTSPEPPTVALKQATSVMIVAVPADMAQIGIRFDETVNTLDALEAYIIRTLNPLANTVFRAEY